MDEATVIPATPGRAAKLMYPVERSTARASEVNDLLRDDAYEPSNTRLRDMGITPELHDDIASGRLVSMGQVMFAENGGSIRTFSGKLPHECGWYPSWKAKRTLHWEGIGAREFVIEGECNPMVDRVITEGIAFHVYLAPKWHTYTADADVRFGGRRHVVEIKRTERDLRDPEYRMVLAAVAEICRRCGWIFRIVLRDEIFTGRIHRENCHLFASRRFVHVSRASLLRLEAIAMSDGPDTTYGRLAAALAPGEAPLGRALVQALTVRRRVGIDLTARVHPRTPVRIL